MDKQGDIFITGDKHGDFIDIKCFSDAQQTDTEDVMIVLGDAGLNYSLNHLDVIKKDFVKHIPITLFCIHGNHEERPYNIKSYKLIDFMGAKAYQEELFPNIIFAKDGEIYNFNGKKVMCIGGAGSVDKDIRLLRGWQGFKSEQPNDEIKEFVEKQLDSVNGKIDYLLTHTCPARYIPTDMFISGVDQSKVDRSTEDWLNMIEKNLNYEKWYCGHWHTDRIVDDIHFMYQDIKHF